MEARAYYNEFDPFAAAWLRELIKAGEIAPGDVDERSIKEVSGNDLKGYTQCHFFAGIGGWSLALRLAGWPDDRAVWTGSCPCQPFSAAGKRKGVADERHLWPDFRRLIAECDPAIVFGEQVASKDGRLWLAGVRADMEALARAFGAADLCAAGVRAPNIRQRLWWGAVKIGHVDRGGWPTPMAGSPGTDTYNAAGNTDSSRRTVALLNCSLDQWPTKVVTPTGAITHADVPPDAAEEVVALYLMNAMDGIAGWPTPNGEDAKAGASNLPHRKQSSLPRTAGWATPKASDGQGGRTTKTQGGGIVI